MSVRSERRHTDTDRIFSALVMSELKERPDSILKFDGPRYGVLELRSVGSVNI